MKNLFLTIALLAATSLISNATIRVVYNNSPSPGQFSTIDAAVSASHPTNGDTIYVQPSPFTYSGCNNIGKKLTIIGGGLAPEKPFSQTTFVNCMNLVNGSQGTIIQGLYFANNDDVLQFSGMTGAVNITVSRCFLYSADNCGGCNLISIFSPLSNLTFNECIFRPGVGSGEKGIWGNNQNVPNLTFNNCVIYHNGNNTGYWITNFSLISGWNFNSCLFYGVNNGSNGSSIFVNSASYNFNFNSCIFHKMNTNMGNSVFTNCLTYGGQNLSPWTCCGSTNSNTSGTNLSNQDPQFVQAFVQNGTTYSFTRNDYAVQSTSPTLMANHPGAIYDMGAYGGSGIFNFNNAHDSSLPLIHSLIIQNPVIQNGQNLNIDVISKKRN